MLEYVNFKRDIYYLHEGTTKKGGAKYWFSKKLEGNLVAGLPNGYEIYEEPNGMVFLRKVQPKVISDNEIFTIENSIPKGLDTKVDIKKNTIAIYLSEGRSTFYQALMRFILVDDETREFDAQRYCFRGSVDDWIWLDSSDDLQKLAVKCCVHLGKDSFYDLPYRVDGFYRA